MQPAHILDRIRDDIPMKVARNFCGGLLCLVMFLPLSLGVGVSFLFVPWSTLLSCYPNGLFRVTSHNTQLQTSAEITILVLMGNIYPCRMSLNPASCAKKRWTPTDSWILFTFELKVLRSSLGGDARTLLLVTWSQCKLKRWWYLNKLKGKTHHSKSRIIRKSIGNP